MSAFSFYFWEKHVKVFSTLVSDIHCKDVSLPCQLIYSLSEVSSDMKVEEYIYIKCRLTAPYSFILRSESICLLT